MQQKNDLLKKIPHVDKLMQNEIIANCEVYRHEVTDAVRDVLAELREGLKTGTLSSVPDDSELAQRAADLATKRAQTQKSVRRRLTI